VRDPVPLARVLEWEDDSIDCVSPLDVAAATTVVGQGDGSGRGARVDERIASYREQRSVSVIDVLVPRGWELDAACRGRAARTYFAEDTTARARGVCRVSGAGLLPPGRPLAGEGYGVWGGTTAAQRSRLRAAARAEAPGRPGVVRSRGYTPRAATRR
jgi:hypothetical protein